MPKTGAPVAIIMGVLFIGAGMNSPTNAAPPDFGEIYLRDISFSADGKLVASLGLSGPVNLWDVGSGKLRSTLGKTEDRIERVAFSPKGNLLATSGEKGIGLWDVSTGTLKTMVGKYGGVWAMAFSGDGKLLAVSDENYSHTANNVTVWDVASAKPVSTIALYRKNVFGIADRLVFSPDRKLLAIGIIDFSSEYTTQTRSAFRLLDLSSNRVLKASAIAGKGYSPYTSSLAFSPSGKMIVTATSEGEKGFVRVWDAKTGKMLKILARMNQANAVAFSPNGRLLAVASGGPENSPWEPEPDGTYRLQILNFRTGKVRKTIVSPPGAHFDIMAYSPRGNLIATQGKAEGIQLWPVPTK